MKYYNWVNCFPRKQREKVERAKDGRWRGAEDGLLDYF
jgi:hypothetical protein